ncbi:DUF551 domain-containing protein [uncultured Methylophaga sp.]|uniref:DUF551 domain-containing protein n=1 Tax=uncultured Methylophaga sp. TaxID=285271 RepID=UPI0030F6E5E1
MTPTQINECTDEKQLCEWVSVEDRLPPYGEPVLVYSPPTEESWPGEVNIEFDVMDEDYEYWLNHSEHYEHFCCVAKPGPESDISMVGPSEKAPYTHWMPIPKPPLAALNGEE